MRRTYLRYPGGKSKAVKLFKPFIPEFDEYREPMVGGGSMFLHLYSLYPTRKFWINDVYENLFCFWDVAKKDNEHLVRALLRIKEATSFESSPEMFVKIRDRISNATDFNKAVGFYYLNKCSFSGLTESGTCSKQAWEQNFTVKSIKSLSDLKDILRNVKITHLDYSHLLDGGENTFIYLDPP